MGATTGIVGATVITLGLLTLPTLIRRGYDPATFVVGYAVEPDIPSETSKVQLTHKAFELMMEFLAEQSKLN